METTRKSQAGNLIELRVRDMIRSLDNTREHFLSDLANVRETISKEVPHEKKEKLLTALELRLAELGE